MTIQIHNTLTRKKEDFTPLKPNKISMYICGITVYDYCHIGHARTFTATDTVVRYLRYRGFDVHVVRNITDIDDKIIKRANDNKEDYNAVTARFIKAMHEDFAALGISTPNDEPRATEFIPQMISLIEKMIANGNAYVASNGDVYYNVRSFSDYGCLSHHNLDQLESGARVEVTDVKNDPLDFVLWKLAKPNEPFWESPWGQGRPGWHTECSAMAMQLLGEQIDIHAGGRDLIFPHHENEIAQSESVSKKRFANVWMHTGFLQIDKEKMSKSLGNFITIREALQDTKPEVLRYFLLASHYRSPLIYNTDLVQQARQALTRMYTALRFLPNVEPAKNTSFEEKFTLAMDDDFNAPVALSVLFELAHEVQRLRETDMDAAAQHGALLRQLGGVMGLLQDNPEAFFQTGSEVDTAKIEKLIAARQQARKEKNWAQADEIRQELSAMSIAIEDNAQGTTWKLEK